jgi:signal transduction histidine kinase
MSGEKRFILPTWARGLSARVLLLTISFVMLAEVLIYIPSLANFRINWLQEKIASAQLAVLTLDATPEGATDIPMTGELLSQLGAHAVVLRRGDRSLMVFADPPPLAEVTIEPENETAIGSMVAALAALFQTESRVMRLVGPHSETPDNVVEVILDDQALCRDILIFSRNVLLLSLAVAVIASSLLYASLQSLMVRPMRRVTEQITEFAHNPEDERLGVKPSGRTDEIGVAQNVLSEMQDEVRGSMKQKEHLAALGSAVSKINHDLRGILSTAVLVSERLANVDDPEVKRISPPLLQAIDRAINLCTQTLNFARDEGPQLTLSRFRLSRLVGEVANDFAVFESGLVSVENQVGENFSIEADRDQLYRVLANLARNAFESGAYNVVVAAEQNDGRAQIRVSDDGPGMSQTAIAGLFKPFTQSTKQGGTGLGLTIARDVMRAHGGDIDLVDTNNNGTVFQLTLPT